MEKELEREAESLIVPSGLMHKANHDVFISYSREDRSRVEAIANYLSDVGFTVFWDPRLNDFEKFESSLREQLRNCRYVMVCWSASAVNSSWVLWEASYAQEENKYVPVTLDDIRPADDDGYQIRSLKNWHARVRPRELRELALNLAHRVGLQNALKEQRLVDRIEEFAIASRLSSIWFLLLLITNYYAMSMWIASQSQHSPLGLLIDERPVQGSVIAIVFVGLFTGLAYRVLNRYLLMHQDENKLQRLPRFPFEPRNQDDGFVKALGFTKVLAALLPVAALVHFFDKIIGHGKLALCDKAGTVVKYGLWDTPSTLTGHVYCIGQGYSDAAIDGATFFPLVEPLVFIIIGIWVLCELGVFIMRFFARLRR